MSCATMSHIAPATGPPRPRQHTETPEFSEFPPCMECDRPANREHFATQLTNRDDQFITYLYCDHCGVGYQTLWIRKGTYRWMMDSSLRYDGENIPKFLNILESLLCVRE